MKKSWYLLTRGEPKNALTKRSQLQKTVYYEFPLKWKSGISKSVETIGTLASSTWEGDRGVIIRGYLLLETVKKLTGVDCTYLWI
jgi:hypothetical protein